MSPKHASPRTSEPGTPEKASFVRRHATGLTAVCFLAGSAVLSMAPGVPDWARPVELSSKKDFVALKGRVLTRPKMTFVKPDTDDSVIDTPVEQPTAVAAVDPTALDPTTPVAPVASASDAGTDPTLAAAAPDLAERVQRSFVDKPGKKARGLHRLGQKLGGTPVAIENPCVAFDERGCLKTALDPYFASLDAVAAGEVGSHATGIVLGNSLLASDHITDVLRARLAAAFGSAGRGFLMADRLSKVAGRRVRTGRGTPGWDISTIAQTNPVLPVFGYTGAHHTATKSGERTTWRLDGAEQADVFWLDHATAGDFRLEIDGKVVETVRAERPRTAEGRVTTLRVPPGSKKLRLVARQSGVVVYGVALGKDRPGIVLDTVGIPAATAGLYLSAEPTLFADQLRKRAPSLVALMLGGNEIRWLAFGKTTPKVLKQNYARLIDRVRRAVPTAACLLIAPIDNVKAKAAGAELLTRAELHDVLALQREVAEEKGCAFYNFFDAMGGEGSLGRYHREGLLNADLVHPTGRGGSVLGEMLARALLGAYADTPIPREKPPVQRRLVRPRLVGMTDQAAGAGRLRLGSPLPLPMPVGGSQTLGKVFAKLRALEDGGARRRVAIGHFGDGLAAEGAFSETLSAQLTERFGDRGTGLVPAGPADGRLLARRVTRRVRGAADIVDGRSAIVGGVVSPAGRRVQLEPGSEFAVQFCDGCKAPGTGAGFVELAWLYTPRMGTAEVLVNDVKVAEVTDEWAYQHDVRFLRVPVRGKKHTVQLRVLDDEALKERAEARLEAGEPPEPGLHAGVLNVLSLSSEADVPGVVYDTMALARTTGMTMQRWREDVLTRQIARRQYDLVLLDWGTEEAQLGDLDETSYTHHLSRTVTRVLNASPGADCMVLGPWPSRVKTERGAWTAAPRLDMVDRVQRAVADNMGCAYFAPADVLTARTRAAWTNQGLLHPDTVLPTRKGLRRMADYVGHALMALYGHERALLEAAHEADDPLATRDAPPGQPAAGQAAPEHEARPSGADPAPAGQTRPAR